MDKINALLKRMISSTSALTGLLMKWKKKLDLLLRCRLSRIINTDALWRSAITIRAGVSVRFQTRSGFMVPENIWDQIPCGLMRDTVKYLRLKLTRPRSDLKPEKQPESTTKLNMPNMVDMVNTSTTMDITTTSYMYHTKRKSHYIHDSILSEHKFINSSMLNKLYSYDD